MLKINGVEYLTTKEAADRLSISPSRVRHYVKDGMLTTPKAKPEGLRDTLISAASVESLSNRPAKPLGRKPNRVKEST